MDVAARLDALGPACAAVASGHTTYDELVRQVIDRAAANGWLDKLDLAGLTAWKRLRADTRWMTALMDTSAGRVTEITAAAVTAARDTAVGKVAAAARARAVLSGLPGFGHGDALASAVCYAAAPDRLAVYDRHAHHALGLLGLSLTDRPGRYGRYIGLLEQCQAEMAGTDREHTLREIDLALYQLGRKTDRATRP